MRDEKSVQCAREDTESRLLLLACIEQHVEPLLASISLYARRMGLDTKADSRSQVVDILQETVLEALDHADRFNTTKQPLAWLRGIAVNVMKRKKAEQAKFAYREISFSRLAAQQASPDNEQDLLDRLLPVAEITSDPGQALESDEEVTVLLNLVSPTDREVVRLAILEDCEGETLAQRLGVSAGTARMRLHRALRRLQTAWVKRQQPE